MRVKKFLPILFLTGALSLLSLTGCNQPRVLPTQGPSIGVTQAYQTVEGRLTEAAVLTPIPATATATLDESEASPPETPTPPDETLTPRPLTDTPTPTQGVPCDKAAPGSPIDVTIDDDTTVEPGERFTKIWRLVNQGSCSWSRDYKAVWFFGTKFGDSLSVSIGDQVLPGQSVDIAVDMEAPETPGTYRSNWMLQNPSGANFGIGPNGSSPFWVQIVVLEPPTATPSVTPLPTATETPTSTPTPEPTPTETPVVVVISETTLSPGDVIDLDTARVNPGSGEDLSYQSDENGNHWLAPVEGVTLGVFGASEPANEACRFATMSSAPISVGSLSPGAFLCYSTDQGRVGWMRLDSVESETFDINIEILTWEVIQLTE